MLRKIKSLVPTPAKTAIKRLIGTRQLMDDIQSLELRLTHVDNERTLDRALTAVRQEYTVMPRFQFHQPLDYSLETFPYPFEKTILMPGDPLPIPGSKDRMGYSPNDAADYLAWGKLDHELIINEISKHFDVNSPLQILDFGCSTGRVLRHFNPYVENNSWKLHGTDVQANCIQWMRENFPPHFNIYTGSTIPHLPFADGTFDVIYGFSVFTHIKYLWDAWILELKRVLRPGGLLIQTIHAEDAWSFYHDNRHEHWVSSALPTSMLQSREMPYDYFYFGDVSCSQVFWKREVARKYWSRYLEVLEIKRPPEKSFQDWMICKKKLIFSSS